MYSYVSPNEKMAARTTLEFGCKVTYFIIIYTTSKVGTFTLIHANIINKKVTPFGTTLV